MTHGLLLKYILSNGIGIDVFHLFWWISESGFKEIEVYFVWDES